MRLKAKNLESKNRNKKKKTRQIMERLEIGCELLLHGAAKPLYLGIALADRSDLPRTIRQELQYLGIFHLFAISGLHIV